MSKIENLDKIIKEFYKVKNVDNPSEERKQREKFINDLKLDNKSYDDFVLDGKDLILSSSRSKNKKLLYLKELVLIIEQINNRLLYDDFDFPPEQIRIDNEDDRIEYISAFMKENTINTDNKQMLSEKLWTSLRTIENDISKIRNNETDSIIKNIELKMNLTEVLELIKLVTLPIEQGNISNYQEEIISKIWKELSKNNYFTKRVLEFVESEKVKDYLKKLDLHEGKPKTELAQFFENCIKEDNEQKWYRVPDKERENMYYYYFKMCINNLKTKVVSEDDIEIEGVISRINPTSFELKNDSITKEIKINEIKKWYVKK